MHKFIAILLLATTAVHNIMSMKRSRPLSLDETFGIVKESNDFKRRFLNTIIRNRAGNQLLMDITNEQHPPQELDPQLWKNLSDPLSEKILVTHFADTFTLHDTIETARNHIKNMNINKKLSDHIHSPQTTLLILRKICGTLPRAHFAFNINTPGMKNYLEKSNSLYMGIQHNKIDSAKIIELVFEGADIDYIPLDNDSPSLLKAAQNSNNSENIATLLELHADLNIK